MAGKIDANFLNLCTSLLAACQEVIALGTVNQTNLAAAKATGANLKQTAKTLQDLAGTVKDLAEHGKALEGKETVQGANDVLSKIRQLLDLEGQPSEKPNQLKELFDNVSTSLIDAQKSLNQNSLEYATELDPRFPQTYFAIPSVKAEMRVGFNEIKGKGINLILFTSSHQKQRYSESTISFEVVGAPPPPGPASYGDYVVPIPRFLVVGKKRDELIEQLIQAKNITEATLINNKHLAIVFEYRPLPEEDPKKEWDYYVVLWPGRRADAAAEDNWHTWLALNMAQEPDGKLRFAGEPNVASIFESPLPPNGMLLVTRSTTSTLAANLTKEQLAILAIQLIDALMRSNMTMRAWLESVKVQPPPALNP